MPGDLAVSTRAVAHNWRCLSLHLRSKSTFDLSKGPGSVLPLSLRMQKHFSTSLGRVKEPRNRIFERSRTPDAKCRASLARNPPTSQVAVPYQASFA